MKKIFLITTFYILFTVIPIRIFAASSDFRQTIYPLTECNDGIDNDADGGIDFATDDQCTAWEDNSEGPDPVSFPNSNQVKVPANLGITQSEISTEIVTPIEEDIQNQVANFANKFLWEPLGSVLGITLGNKDDSSQSQIDMSDSLLIAVSIIYLVSLSGLGIFLIQKLIEAKDRKTL